MFTNPWREALPDRFEDTSSIARLVADGHSSFSNPTSAR